MRSLLAPLLALIAITGCVSTPQLPPPQVRRGDTPARPGAVVVFSPKCRGVAGPCSREFTSTVLGRLSSELELAGYRVIDGDSLFAEARRRTHAGGSVDGLGPFGQFWVGARGGVESTVSYEDLPPAGKRALLEEARADGVVTLSVMVGENQVPSLWYSLHVFELTARYSVGEDEQIAWVARCSAAGENQQALGGIGVSYTGAADQLARCVATSVL